jgi:hypothetical protein
MYRHKTTKSALLGFFAAIIALASCHGFHRTANQSRSLDRASLIVDNQGLVGEPVQELMRLTGIEPVSSLKEVVEKTQKKWIRSVNVEREDLFENHQELKSPIFTQLSRLGLLSSVMPAKGEYDYVLLLGATYQTYKSRLKFLEEIIESGIKVKTIALLGSLRPLEHGHELSVMVRDQAFKTSPINEIEMMEMLFKQSSLKGYQTVKIASPMKNNNGQLVRANTLDTVVDFANLNLRPGSVLVISNQPYVIRQGLVVRRVLKWPWRIETVGPKPRIDTPTSVYFDELARTLYEINAAALQRISK